MKTALRFFSVFSLAFFFFAAGARAVEGKPEYGSPAGTIVVADGLNQKDVQRGIMEAGAARDFIIKTREDERVVLYKEDGAWTMVLTFVFDTKEIQIFSKTVRDGQPKLPERDIKRLKADISKKLNTLAVTK